MSNFWQGEQIKLRALELSDEDFFFKLNEDTDLAQLLDQRWFPPARESIKEWIKKESANRGENDNFFFIIEDQAEQPVGLLSTFRCNKRVGSFSYGVGILPDHFRKGYASEAIRLVLHHFFKELRYQKVTVHVYSNNERSLTFHKQFGFTEEGRHRRMVYTDGQYYDWVFFGMLAEEFEERYGKKEE